MTTNKKLPGIITFFASWHFLKGVGAILNIFSLSRVVTITVPGAPYIRLNEWWYVVLFFNALGFFTGYGLLKLRNWARVMAIISAVVSLVYLFWLFNAVSLGVEIVIFFTLLNNKYSLLFSKTKRESRKRKESSPREVKKYLGQAHLGLGKVFEAKNNVNQAFDNYKKAKIKGASLHDGAIILMGNCYAEKGAQHQKALDIYFSYIKLRLSETDESSKVYSIVREACQVQEGEKLTEKQRKEKIELNQNLIAVNSDVFWAHYYLGLVYILGKKFSESIEPLESCLKIAPDHPEAYFWLGKAYLKQRKVDQEKLTRVYKKFLEFPLKKKPLLTKQGEAAFVLGQILFDQLGGFESSLDFTLAENKNKLLQAVSLFENASSKLEKNSEYFLYLAKAYSLNDESSKAIESYQRAIDLTPDNKEYFYHLADEYKKIKSLKKAKDCLESALKLDEKYVEGHRLLAEIFLLTMKYRKAEDECLTVIEIMGYDERILLLLIQALYHQEKFIDVIKEIEKHPAFKTKKNEVNEASFCIARSYAQTDEFDKAVKWFEGLPKEPRNLYYFGCTFANMEKFKDALLLFEDVINQENSFTFKALLQRGHVFLKTGKLEKAEKDYQRAQESEPENPEVLTALGCLYFNSGILDKASSYFSDTLKVEPDNNLSHFGMGMIMEKKEKFSEAVKEYNAVQENEELSYFSSLCMRQGIVYCKESDYEKAFERLERMKQSKSEHDTFLFYYGMSSILCGRIEEAKEAWQKLHEKYPDDERLELNIHRAKYLAGVKHIEENNYPDAISEWEEYLKKYETDEKTKKDLAELYFRTGIAELLDGNSEDWKKAKTSLKKAVELDSENHPYLYHYGLHSLRVGDYSSAIKQLSQLHDRQSINSRIKYHLALSLLLKGEKEKAMTIFKEVSRGKSSDEYSAYAYGVIANEYIKEGNYGEAISILEGLL